MTTLDDLLGLPSISEMQSGGGNIPLSPIYIYQKDTLRTKLTAEPTYRLELFKIPIILTSTNSTVPSISGFAEFSEKSGLPTSSIVAINGLAALALINAPESDTSGFKKYVFETSRESYKTEEVLREQKVFISLFNQIHFIAFLNNDISVRINDSFKNKFVAVQRLLSKIDFGAGSGNSSINDLSKKLAALQIGGTVPIEPAGAAAVPVPVPVQPPVAPQNTDAAVNGNANAKLLEAEIIQHQNARFKTLTSLLEANSDVKVMIGAFRASVPSYKVGEKLVNNILYNSKYYKLLGLTSLKSSDIIDNITTKIQSLVDKYTNRVYFGPVGFYDKLSTQQQKIRTTLAGSSNLDPSCKVIHIWFGSVAVINKTDGETINEPSIFNTEKGQVAGIFGIAVSAKNLEELTKSFTQTHTCPPGATGTSADSTVPIQGSIAGLSEAEAAAAAVAKPTPIEAKKPQTTTKPVAPPVPPPAASPDKPAVPAVQQKVTEVPAPPTVSIMISNTPLDYFKILLAILQDYFELPQERRKEINAILKIVQDGPRSVYLYMYNGLRAEQGLPIEPESKLLETQGTPATAAAPKAPAAAATAVSEERNIGPLQSNVEKLNRVTKIERKAVLQLISEQMNNLLCGDTPKSNVGCGRMDTMIPAIKKIKEPTLFRTQYNRLLEIFDAADILIKKANTSYESLTKNMQNRSEADKIKKTIDGLYGQIQKHKETVNALPIAEGGKLAESIRLERLSTHGINNPNIYCYGNSAVQALYSIPEVRQAVLDYDCSLFEQVKGSIDEQLDVQDYQKVLCLLQKAFNELNKNTALFSDANKKDNGPINFSIKDLTDKYWDFKQLPEEKSSQADASGFAESMIDDILKDKKILDVEKLFQYTENIKTVCSNKPEIEKDLRTNKYTLFKPENLNKTCNNYQDCFTQSVNQGQTGIIIEKLETNIEGCGSKPEEAGEAESHTFYSFESKYLFIKPQYTWNNGVFVPSTLMVNPRLQIRKNPNEESMNDYMIYGLIYWSGRLNPKTGKSSGHYYYIRFDDTVNDDKPITEIPCVSYNDSKVTFSPAATAEQLKNAVVLIYKNTSISEPIPPLPVEAVNLQLKETPAPPTSTPDGPSVKPSESVKPNSSTFVRPINIKNVSSVDEDAETATGSAFDTSKSLSPIRDKFVSSSESPTSWQDMKKTLLSLRNTFARRSAIHPKRRSNIIGKMFTRKNAQPKANQTKKSGWFSRKSLSNMELMRGKLLKVKLEAENTRNTYEEVIRLYNIAKTKYNTQKQTLQLNNVIEATVDSIDIELINRRLKKAESFLRMLKTGMLQTAETLTEMDALVVELTEDVNQLNSIINVIKDNTQKYNNAIQKIQKLISGFAVTPNSAINLAAMQTQTASSSVSPINARTAATIKGESSIRRKAVLPPPLEISRPLVPEASPAAGTGLFTGTTQTFAYPAAAQEEQESGNEDENLAELENTEAVSAEEAARAENPSIENLIAIRKQQQEKVMKYADEYQRELKKFNESKNSKKINDIKKLDELFNKYKSKEKEINNFIRKWNEEFIRKYLSSETKKSERKALYKLYSEDNELRLIELWGILEDLQEYIRAETVSTLNRAERKKGGSRKTHRKNRKTPRKTTLRMHHNLRKK